MDINANDLNESDEFDNPYGIDYELNCRENENIQHDSDAGVTENSDDATIDFDCAEIQPETSKV